MRSWRSLRMLVRVRSILLSSALILIAAAAMPAGELTFLRTQGHDIVDANGGKVLLRGVGLGNWMLPEGYMWKFGEQGDRPRRIEKLVSDLIGSENADRFWTEFRQSYITEADIRRIAELGYNSVRPALNARLFLTESDPPTPVAEGFQLLDNLVKWCKTHGLYVIIDMHGAPGGQTGQNIDDSANDVPELFANIKYQDRLVDLWVAIARRYKDEPAVAGYDLLNEPLPARTGAAAKYKHLVEPLYRRLTKAIRDVDAKHMIILEGVDWANDWSIFTEPFDANLVYQFHYYCWDNPAKLKGVDRYLDYRKRFNAPIWVGETGERDNTIYWGTTEYFEVNNIGWSFWPWKKMDTANTPYSINRPQQWNAVATYSRGGAKPARDIAEKTLTELLANIRLENCVYHEGVVNAMLRRVPARIEGENFAHDGPAVSYSVKREAQRSQYYRPDESVTIKMRETQRPRTDQFIVLSTNEWTVYRINNDIPRQCTITLGVYAEESPASAQLQINGKPVDVSVPEGPWAEVKLDPVQFNRGINELKWTIKRGSMGLDWMDVRPVADSRQAPGGGPTAAGN